MSDNIETVVPEGTADVVEPSGLPSDVEAKAVEDKAAMELPERWASVQEMSDHIKNMEDKYSNLNRDLTDKEKKQQAELEATVSTIEKEAEQTQLVESLIPEFLGNGMVVTDDMKSKMLEAGLSEDKIKLGAYEFKESLEKHQNYVGGKENYDIIMAWGKENLSDDDKASFNTDIRSSKSELTMLGLQVKYERSLGESESKPVDRIRGDTTVRSSHGYETKQEIYRDKAYIDSPAGRKDAGAIARFKNKMALTDKTVYKSK